MKVKQISVFLENKSGRLADVVSVLADAGIDIKGLSLADTTDFGILRLIVDNNEDALKLLISKGFTAAKTEVLAIAVPDVPGGLSNILKKIRSDEINVEYMYVFTGEIKDNVVVIFRFDDIDRAIDAMKKAGVDLLKEKDIYIP